MFRAPRALRRWTIGWALLQLLLSPLAALADGAAERAGAGARLAHVEAAGERECPPVHGADCAVCRQLGGNGVPAAARLPAPATVSGGEFQALAGAVPVRHPEGAGRQRAPPAAA